MGLWKITSNGPQRVPETRFKQEKLLEEHVEDWIAADPLILGEPLLIIGRQVLIPDTKDRLDLLAVDPRGSAVIIELKRGQLKDPVDIQALRYASYISKWSFKDFENVARNYLGKVEDADFNFNELFETFCEDSAAEELPDLNADQRIIIVGSDVKDKLGSVALWLREHSIDIKLFEVRAYKSGDDILIEPNLIVPHQVSRFQDVGRVRTDGSPWMIDGKAWHLDKRCSPQTKNSLLTLDKLLQDKLELDGPHWNQKYYVAYRIDNYNWLRIHTKPKALWLDFFVKVNSFDVNELATRLSVAKFDQDESLSEKLALPSSVLVKNRNDEIDRVRLRLKADFDVESDQFVAFLVEAYQKYPK